MTGPRIEPLPVVEMVEEFVRKAHHDNRKYDNVTLLEDGQVWDLHTLASDIYAAGFKDGSWAESRRRDGAEARARDAAEAEK